MNKQQCPNGHFYDTDMYTECPHCSDSHTTNVTNSFVVKPNQIILDVNNGIVRSCTDQGLSITLSKFAEINSSASSSNQKTHDNNVQVSEKELKLTSEPDIATDETTALFTDQNTHKEFIHAEIQPEESQPEEIQVEDPQAQDPQPEEYTDNSYDEMINPIAGWLVCTGGRYYGRSFNIYFGQNSIGRDITNMIALPYEEDISERNHLMVTYEPIKNRFYIIPGRNTGMTYLNGEYLTEAKRLSDRDIIGVGGDKCKLMFVALCDEKFNWTQNTTE